MTDLVPELSTDLPAGILLGMLATAEQGNHDLFPAWATGSATAPEPADPSSAGLQVQGEGVVMSSLRRRSDCLKLRLVAEHLPPMSITVRGGVTAAGRRDLRGRPGEVIGVVTAGSVSLVLNPWEITTLQVCR